jgi:uncharacterized protein YndB with AHSA1/START domain
VPTARRRRTIAAPPHEVWRVVGDVHHLPRWWPRVVRVEGVRRDNFTMVLRTDKGKTVRADFAVTEHEPPRWRAWAQDVEGTPFERVMHAAETSVAVKPRDEGGTEVTLTTTQRLRGLSALGGFLVRRATGRILDEALDGLEETVG